MPAVLFSADDFTPTPFATAQEKAKFATQLAKFIDAGAPRAKFTKSLYNRLNGLFGHIAHYDADGFYDEWFSSPEALRSWLRNALSAGGYGSPSHTWYDVELAFRAHLRSSGVLERNGL